LSSPSSVGSLSARRAGRGKQRCCAGLRDEDIALLTAVGATLWREGFAQRQN
jgi:hypothetical protein